MEGWIELHRKFITWEWFHDSKMVHLFIYILLSANYTEKQWQGITIKRGQLLTGLNSLSKNTSISVQSLRTCLSKLEKTGELTSKSTNKYSILTVCNYELYQGSINGINNQTNKQLTNNQQTTNKQSTTTNKEKKDNKDNKEKKEPSFHAKMREEFESFYFKQKEIEYYWQAKDGMALKQIITKLKKHSEDEDKILEAWQVILQHNNDKWINDNLSVSIINSKYNEIIAKMKGSAQGSQYNRQEIYDLLNQK